jgi:hypothetical protein
VKPMMFAARSCPGPYQSRHLMPSDQRADRVAVATGTPRAAYPTDPDAIVEPMRREFGQVPTGMPSIGEAGRPWRPGSSPVPVGVDVARLAASRIAPSRSTMLPAAPGKSTAEVAIGDPVPHMPCHQRTNPPVAP